MNCPHFRSLGFACLTMLLWSRPVELRAATLVAEDDTWRYLKGWSEASVPDPAAWRTPAFNDAAWESGRGPFFYELGAGYFGNTDLPDMSGGYTCVFLRRAFELTNPGSLSALNLELRTDDGCIVWLNGHEIGRVNMPEGEPGYQSTSLPASGEPNIATIEVTNPAPVLRSGRNVLAVQAFNSSLSGSSDFLIAVALTSPMDQTPPLLLETFPPAGATVRELTQIEVVFDEAVSGVEAGDLRVNGTPATSLEIFSPRNYAFHFAEPPVGRVQMAWASNHGIQDLAAVPNAFAGGTWTYTLDKSPRTANVVISEFLADNQSGIRDDFAERSDWIELLNLETTPVDFDGWFLTDDANRPTKWKFPPVTIAAGGYLVVWASERNLANPAKPLHTSFKLGASGEYLALFDPQTNVVSDFAPAFPRQLPDTSYGRAAGNPEITGFFPTPTPGTQNGTSGPGFAPAPEFSLPGGYYTNVPVTLGLTAPSGVIRYTTNGTVPNESSPAYTVPFELTTSTVIHARVFEAGLLPGPVVVQAYAVAGTGLAGFGSNLPLLVIHTAGRSIPQDSRIPVCVSLFEPFRGRTTLASPPTLISKAQMEVRGQSSTGFPKPSYNLELNDPYGHDSEQPLLDLPAESDWVLYAPYTDKPLIHNFLAYELHREMGHWAPRCRFVEVFLDTAGRLDYNADYRGIYILMEKIKVDNNRVAIARLSPLQNAEPEISGGYMIKKDKDSPGDRGFSTTGGGGFSGQYLKFHEPKPREITPAQQTWIRNYLNRFESALYASNWLTRTGTNHYSSYMDVDSFVDNHWIVEFAKQIDGYRLSNYMHKDRGGKLRMDPIWDWNLSFGNADYLDGQNTSGWYYSLIGDNEHIWLRRLISGTAWAGGSQGDPDFNQRIADRWSELRTNIFSASRVRARIDELAAYLGEAQVREFKRWPRLGQYVWPNPPIYSTPTTYAGVVNAMKNWVLGRYNWIDSQFLVPPTFSRPGGGISPGFPLELTARTGTIYYTTDGTDPRAPGGGIAAQARPYTTDVVLQANSRVVARLRNGTRWSGPSAASFIVDTPRLALTELMYRPRLVSVTDTNDPASYEFIELQNTGQNPLDLRGFAFTDGVEFAFATGTVTALNPGARVVIANHVAAFTQRYGALPALAGEFTGSLDNEGERLTLRGPHQEMVFSLTYDPDGQPAADGLGFALVAADAADAAGLDDAQAWRVGSVLDGTPGQPEPEAPRLPTVLVNEVLAHTDPPLLDAIELHNPGDQPADISGWFLTDDRRTPKFRIPPGSVIPAQGYRVFTEADFNASPDAASAFNLRASGDEVYLLSADLSGRLTGYLHGFDFGASLSGVSFGRHVTTTGEEHFVAQTARTLGAANAGPRVGPVVIGEIMYHPPDLPANGALWDDTESEYLELANLGLTDVPLFDPQASTNTWRLRDAVQFAFPTNQLIRGGERLLVVSFDPRSQPGAASAFRARYGLSSGTRLFGPFQGKLANDRNQVELVQPDVVRFYGTNDVVTGVLVDKVAYRDELPWPVGADGIGFSLQRLNEGGYGDDPANWTAAAPTPGALLAASNPPLLIRVPGDQSVSPGSSVVFSVEAAGPGPLQYQWRFNGATLPGLNSAILSFSAAQPTNSGLYEVVVWNPSRAVTSAPARLRVGLPPVILRHPAPIEAAAGATAVFSVVAAGVSPLEYQWRKDGQPVAAGVRHTLTIPSLQLTDAATYDVVVRDEAGSTTSQPAALTVLASPVIVQSPVSQLVPAASTLTLSVAVAPTATLPLTFTWTRNGVSIATHTRSGYLDFLTISEAQLADAGLYRVGVANRVTAPTSVLSEPAQVQVATLPDADDDGMPDAFELQFGLRPNAANDAANDPDGDGASNLEEYRAGTEPNNPASVLQIEPPDLDNGVTLRFQAQANRTYALLATDGPADAPWRVVAVLPAMSDAAYQPRRAEFHDPGAVRPGGRFYRVVTPGFLE